MRRNFNRHTAPSLQAKCWQSAVLWLVFWIVIHQRNDFFFFLMFWNRNKRAHVPLTECIFELPNLTVQATRAQTLLLQTIYQSWCHPVGSVSSVVVNEALLNEVFQYSGKFVMFLVKYVRLIPLLCYSALLVNVHTTIAFKSRFLCRVVNRQNVFCVYMGIYSLCLETRM